MGITRKQLAFEGKFVQIPNDWIRDATLSRRARGLLAEVMSHRIGWHISISSLQHAGTEGRDAIRSALAELLEAGYLVRSQPRGGAGRFNEVEYELADPATADWKPDTGGFTGDGLPADGLPAHGKSDTKKTITSEDHLSEDDLEEVHALLPPIFSDFWAAWPKSNGKKAAEAAWSKAIKRASPEAIVQAARDYAAAPYRPAIQFVPYGATWLNGDLWEDDLPQAPEAERKPTRTDQNLDFVAQLAREQEQQQRGLTA